MSKEPLPLGLPYTDHAYVEAGVDRLRTIAVLHGWEAPALRSCRALDLGCGRGAHLLSQAATLPEAQFVGIDLAEVHIEEASLRAEGAGVANIKFRAASLFDEPWRGEKFDYITAHGVASWLPPESRRALFRVIERALTASGVAYVSANILPGWYSKMGARDFLMSLRRGAKSVTPETALAELSWLETQIPGDNPLYRAAIHATRARLVETDPAYLAHEFWSAAHHPESVRTLLEEAAAAGLTYLGDAAPASSALELLSDEARARALASDDIGGEELIDFIRGTAFRRMLFVRTDSAAARTYQRPRELSPSNALPLLWLKRKGATDARDEVIGLPKEVERALELLRESWPHATAHTALAAAVAADPMELAHELVSLWLATGSIELRSFEPKIVAAPSAYPRACPVARYHAAHGAGITNVWHHSVVLDHPVLATLLARLDGTKNRDALAEELYRERASDQGRSISSDEAERVVTACLSELASMALLIG